MQEWHIDFLRRRDMVCLRATDQNKVIFSSTEKPSCCTSCEADQADISALLAPNSLTPEVSEYSSYFPARILGYLSYEDEPDSPQDE